jgi:hypothetical protein
MHVHGASEEDIDLDLEATNNRATNILSGAKNLNGVTVCVAQQDCPNRPCCADGDKDCEVRLLKLISDHLFP